MTFEHIDQKKKRLDEKRPLPVNTVKSLRENMLIEWTYNSNAIEGNTLSISETKVVLEGITIGGKSMKEHLEVINHRDAIVYLEELMKAGFPPVIIKKDIRSEYYDSLDPAHTTGDYGNFFKLVTRSTEESLDLWLSVG